MKNLWLRDTWTYRIFNKWEADSFLGSASWSWKFYSIAWAPEWVLTASPGSICSSDNGNTYIKKSWTGTTGWELSPTNQNLKTVNGQSLVGSWNISAGWANSYYQIWYANSVYYYTSPANIWVDASNWAITVDILWTNQWDTYIVKKLDDSSNAVSVRANVSIDYWYLMQGKELQLWSYTLTESTVDNKIQISTWYTDGQFQTELILADDFSSWWDIILSGTNLTTDTVQWAEIFDRYWNNYWALVSTLEWWLIKIKDINSIAWINWITILVYLAEFSWLRPVVSQMKVQIYSSVQHKLDLMLQDEAVTLYYTWDYFITI